MTPTRCRACGEIAPLVEPVGECETCYARALGLGWTHDHDDPNGPYAHYHDDDYDDYYDRDVCDRCGGDGHIEYAEAGPSVWGEDCPSEENHLIECPECGGTGEAE